MAIDYDQLATAMVRAMAEYRVVENVPMSPMSDTGAEQPTSQIVPLSLTHPDIAKAIQNNEGSKAQLAKRFGVSESTIARIKRELKGGN